MTDLVKQRHSTPAENLRVLLALRGHTFSAAERLEIEEAADALESAGELPEHEGYCHTKLDTPRQVHACNCDWPKRIRTAYSALAARFERMQKERAGWESDTSSVARLLQQAESRIAELEQKVSVIYDGNAVYAEMSVDAHARTSPENVSDTLDSVNRIWKQLSTDKGEG